ncbi:hypothetical protein HispidOSU_011415 [Sigmodon hispidus]
MTVLPGSKETAHFLRLKSSKLELPPLKEERNVDNKLRNGDNDTLPFHPQPFLAPLSNTSN